MSDFSLSAQYQNNNNDIALAWSKIYPGPYSLYVSNFVDGPWSLVKTTQAAAFVYSNASSNKYFFQVFSSKFKPNTSIQYSSNIVSVSPAQTATVGDSGHFVRGKVNLGQPFLSLTDDAANSQVLLSWPSIDNATYYGVYRTTSGQGSFQHLGDTQGTSFGDGAPYSTAFSVDIPVYTYYVVPATPTLYGPQSNTKDYFLAMSNGSDPVLGPPYPPVFYQLFVHPIQPRLTWTVPDVLVGGDVNVIGPNVVGVYITNYTAFPSSSIFYLHCRQKTNDLIARDVTDLQINPAFGLIGDSENNGSVTWNGGANPPYWEVNFVNLGLSLPLNFYVNAIYTPSVNTVTGSLSSQPMFGLTNLTNLTGTFAPYTIPTGPTAGTASLTFTGHIAGFVSGTFNGSINFGIISGSIRGPAFVSYTNYLGTSSNVPSQSISQSFTGSLTGALGNAVVVGYISGSVTRTLINGRFTGSFSGSSVGLVSGTSSTSAFGINTVVDSQILTVTG